MYEELNNLSSEFRKDLDAIKSKPVANLVEKLRLDWIGKKGRISKEYSKLNRLPKDERPKFGKQLNILKQDIEKNLQILKDHAVEFGIEENLSKPEIDISLPSSTRCSNGGIHPISLVQQKMCKIFKRYGFTVYEGPELDHDFYNFTALNIPHDHPSRDMQDTFFVKENPLFVLRTHTSNVQIHTMLQEKPPLRIISPGRVYRVDNDATHSPMFHQMECVVVDKGISFAHLKGMIQAFMTEIFGSNVKTRFRPSFFPFVEPGAEIDIYGPNGWLEIGGCGMIHPNVFESVNYDSEIYTGYAFGFGLDRMAMTLFGLSDLRLLFEGDFSFHSQFSILP